MIVKEVSLKTVDMLTFVIYSREWERFESKSAEDIILIIELKKELYYRCKPIVNRQGHLEVKAVIEGNNPGRVFVDNAVSPTAGLVWLGNHDGFYFIGNPKNEGFIKEIPSFIDETIAPEAKKAGLQWFEGFGNDPHWDETIKSLFSDRPLGCWNQKIYSLPKEQFRYENEPVLLQEYSFCKLSEDIYWGDSLKNLDYLHYKIGQFWQSPEDFFRCGIGYAIIHENSIVSLCFSSFVYKDTHGIDIQTVETHRGKNLAKKAAYYFVRDCFENKITPYWDCMEANKPSVSLAEGLGFKNDFISIGYEFPF